MVDDVTYDPELDTFDSELQQREENFQVDSVTQEVERKAALLKQAPGDEVPDAVAGPAQPTNRSVIKEAVVGPLELPAQVVGGALDAVGNTANGMGDMADFMDDVFNFPTELPSTGSDTIDKIATALLRPLDTVGNLSGFISAPTTLVGGFGREVAKFMTGFIPALRAAKAVGLTRVTASATAGAVTGATVINPDDPNLANIVADLPIPDVLKAPFDILAVNPDDPKLLARAKNTIVEAGLGAGAEVVMKGLQTVAQSRRAKKLLEGGDAPVAPIRTTAEEIAPIGNLKQPLVQTKNTKAQAKLAEAEKDIGGLTAVPVGDTGESVFINFARLETTKNVDEVLQSMADAFKGQIDEARRGVITQSETKKLASDLGMTVDDLLQRNTGEAFNAENLLAARQLFAASGKKVEELSVRAATAGASEVDLFLLRKQMTAHVAIEKQFFGARAEAARSLGAMRIPVSGEEAARAISQMMDNLGGPQITQELAARIASASKAGTLTSARLNIIMRRGWLATTRDAVKESFVLGMLWDPTTHIVNTISNSAMLGVQIPERALAAQLAKRFGDGTDSVAVGEAGAMAAAVIDGFGDAIVYAGRAFRSGDVGRVMGKTEIREATITAERIGVERSMSTSEIGKFRESYMGRGIDLFGNMTRIPGRALAAEDEFFKTLGYRMEVRAQAVRAAANEGLTGKAAAERIAGILNDPSPSIKLAAADAALYNTFQNQPGRIIRGLMMARDSGSMNPSFLVLPFMRTLGNIGAATFERSPVAFLVKRWRADVAAGGPRREIALARMSLGTMFMSTANELATSGFINGAGPSDPADNAAWRRLGNQPFSATIGGVNFTYDRFDPMGSQLAMASTINERFNETELSEEDMDQWLEALVATGAVVGESITDRAFFSSLNNLMFAFRAASTGSSAAIRSLVDRTTSSFIPFQSAANFTRKFIDPVSRQPMNPMEAIQAKFPVFSQKVLKRRDLWGQPIGPEEIFGRLPDVFSPVKTQRIKNSPIDQEMVDLEAGVPRIPVQATFSGVRMNFREFPGAYDKYRLLAGNDLKHPGWQLGARDYLNAVVTGNHAMSSLYETLSDTGKATFISSTISDYRRLSAEQIMTQDEFPDFQERVKEKQQKAFEESLPRGVEAPQLP